MVFFPRKNKVLKTLNPRTFIDGKKKVVVKFDTFVGQASAQTKKLKLGQLIMSADQVRFSWADNQTVR